MIKGTQVTTICILIFLYGIFSSVICYAKYDYIDITNPFLRKVPIAIPVFKSLSKTPDEIQISRSASDLLAQTLEFTRYFMIIDRDAFLDDHGKSGITASAISFKNWTGIGAELFITGGILIKKDLVEIELRLYDTFKAKLLVGKKYQGGIKNIRKIIRRFASEVVYNLTGSRGIFNSKIAFVSTVSGNKEIFICDFDGYDPKRYTYNNSITLFPSWSSDGQWISYTSYKKGKPDIYIENFTQKRGTIVSRKGINITPAWVPGRFELAATFSFSGDQEIYLLTGKGKIIKRLTRNRGIDSSPSWSPDGKKIAFISKRSGTPQIYTKDLTTNQVRRLTFYGRYNTQPCWSPRGDKIAYSSMENGSTNICVIGIDGFSPVQLTEDAGDNESPSWSPDGSLIVFSSTREGPSRIYIMNAFGTDQRRLLALPAEQTDPAWSSGVKNF